MKRVVKKISLMLVMLMVTCQIWPAIQAKAASLPSLKYTSKVIYIDGDSLGKYNDNCWVPSQNTTGYNVNYQITSGGSLISVTKNGKVTVTGNGVGSAVIKATYTKSGQKDITANFTVKVRRNAVDVKLTDKSVKQLDEAINVGDSLKFEAAKSYDGSYEDGHYGLDNYRGVVNDSLKIESLTPNIATTNGFTLTAKAAGTAQFVVKAYQYGDDKFTGVISKVYTIVIKDPQPTPTPTPVISVKQTSTTTIELSTSTTYTSAPSTSAIKLNKIVLTASIETQIRSITVDSIDKSKLLIETFASLNDNNEYEIVYNNEKYKFTSSDGKIASLSISPTQIEEMAEAEIFVSTFDKNGVLLGKYNQVTAYNVDGLELIITADNGNGYSTGEKFVLINAGNTAKVKAIYHTRNYDNYGNEVGNLVAETTIVATKAATVTTGPYKYTIASTTPNYSSMTTNNIIEVDQQGKYIYFYITNSKGEDISYEYTLSSSNIDALILGSTMMQSKGIMAEIYAVTAPSTPVFIIVSKGNTVYTTLQVNIRAKGTLARMDIDKAELSLSNYSSVMQAVKVTLYDNYNQKMSDEIPAIELLTAPNTSMSNTVKQNISTYAQVDLGKVNFNAIGLDPGKYTYKITYGTLTRVVTINVSQPNTNLQSTYRVVLSATTIDAAISADDLSNKAINIQVAELKGGIIYSYLPLTTSLVVKDSSGNIINTSTNGSNTWTVSVADLSSNPVTKLSAGTYTVTATINGINYPASFVVTDTQGGVTAGLVNSSVNSGTWENVLANAYDFIYKNENMDSYISSLTYLNPLTGYSLTTAYAGSYVSAGSYPIRSITINVPVGSYIVPITVAVSNTVTVK